MMLQQISANAPGDVMMPVSQAIAEPMVVAASWVSAPPWAVFVIVALTMALLALSHREPRPAPHAPS